MNRKLNIAPSPHRFKLANQCPCGKSNKDGKFCPEKNNPNAGFCHGCGRVFFGEDRDEKIVNSLPTIPIDLPTSYHQQQLLNQTLRSYNKNNFLIFCKSIFPDKEIFHHARIYGVGTSNLNHGNSTVFWQIDMDGRVRGGKIIKYNRLTGKRIQSTPLMSNVTWVHKVCKISDFNLKQCLFGLHLTTGNNKTIAVVESEKTAFLMSLIDESRIWVATGGKENFKYDLLKHLKGRTVIAYPDNGEFENWKAKAMKLGIYGIHIFVSNKLESPTLPKGWDLADQLIHSIQAKVTVP